MNVEQINQSNKRIGMPFGLPPAMPFPMGPMAFPAMAAMGYPPMPPFMANPNTMNPQAQQQIQNFQTEVCLVSLTK